MSPDRDGTGPAARGGELRAATFARVSTPKQDPELQDLGEWVARRGVPVVREFSVQDSAWLPRAGKGRVFDAERAALVEGARLGEFNVAAIWALDRLSRRGIADATATLEQLWSLGVEVWSRQESWVEAPSPMRPLMVAIFGWMAEQESQRKSERVRMSVDRRRAQGLPVGRQRGATDSGKRRVAGYHAHWESPDGERRKAELAARNASRPRAPMSDELAARIAEAAGLAASGLSQRAVAGQMGCSQAAVGRYLARAREEGIIPQQDGEGAE